MKHYYAVIPSDGLTHYGIKGMKWGARRKQLKEKLDWRQKLIDKKVKKKIEQERRTHPKSTKHSSRILNGFDKARADGRIKSFDDIYKEMGADMTQEDSSYYKEIEAEWLKQNGYWNE